MENNHYPPMPVIVILILQLAGLACLLVTGQMHSPLGIAAAFTAGSGLIAIAIISWLVLLIREAKEISSDVEKVLNRKRG